MISRTATLLSLLVSVALPPACRAQRTAPAGIVTLLEYVTAAPTGWQTKPPSSSMRLAEFTTPAVAGTEPGQVVVYFFGVGQGGDVAANVERWKAQFTDASGAHPQPTITKLTGAAFPSTVVELRGSYARGVGMGGPPETAKPNQILLAAVVETPKGNLYVQLHGPAASVTPQKDAFLGFIRQLHVARSGA